MLINERSLRYLFARVVDFSFATFVGTSRERGGVHVALHLPSFVWDGSPIVRCGAHALLRAAQRSHGRYLGFGM
jgi:hypothetical protein